MNFIFSYSRPPPVKVCTYIECSIDEELCGTTCYNPRTKVMFLSNSIDVKGRFKFGKVVRWQIVFEGINRGTFGDMSGKTVPKKNNPDEKRVSKKRNSAKIRS